MTLCPKLGGWQERGKDLTNSLHDSGFAAHYVVGMLRSVRILSEFIAAFLGLVVLVAALVIWRLSSSPINSTFLTPYVEGGISRYIPGAHPKIEHTLVTWDNVDYAVLLHADKLVITNAKDKVIAEVPSLDIRLSLIGLLVGQFWPKELTVDHPQVKLERRGDGKLYFADLTSDDNVQQVDTHEVMKNVLHGLTHAYAMRHLTVLRAVLDVHDVASNSNWSVSVPEISLKHMLTQLVGDAHIDLTQKDKPASLDLRYSYDRLQSLHHLSTRFSEITPSQLAGGHPETLGFGMASGIDLPLSGEAEVAFDPELEVAAMAATLHGGKGILKIPALWDKPRLVTVLDLEGEYDRRTHRLNVPTAMFDFDGAKLKLTASGHAPREAAHYDLDFKLTSHIENWPMSAFDDLWPKPIIPNAREWMVHNLTHGTYDKGDASFIGSLAWNDLENVLVSEGQGKISASHGTVYYIDGMPPVQNVRTDASFDLQQMSLDISDGGLGDLVLQPFMIKMTDLDKNLQYIDIPLKLSGPVSDVIKLIDHEPLRYAQKVGLPDDALSGFVEGTVHLHFPMLKSLETKDIDVTASAQLTKVASTQLVKGLDLSQGDLTLDLDKDGLMVKGMVAVNKLPFQLNLQEMFHEQEGKPLRQVNLIGTIGDEQWALLDTDVFSGTHGTGFVTLQMTQPKKDLMVFSGNLDLTNADFHLAPLNWKKPAGVQAVLQFDAERAQGKDVHVKSVTLRSPQARINGKAVVGTDGSIKSASFEPFAVGRTLANLYFTQTPGEDGVMRFDARGKSLDVSGMTGGKDPGRSDPRAKEFHLKLDKLYTSDKGVIISAEGYAIRDSEGWDSISLQGFADGEHRFDLDLMPKPDGTRELAIQCDEFGKMLKGFGFTDTVQEGAVKIEGSSTVEQPRVIHGTIDIGGFSVGGLPALMQLLNATSPFGFVGLVTNRTSFDSMKGKFRWTGDVIDLRHVNVAGPVVGLNINGKVDMNSGHADLSGTLVPFNMVNNILGYIPLIGDLLTGGDGGGVLAVAYGIKGPLSDPSVSVNPVSLLTPGFLRNLFFGEGNDDEDVPASSDAAHP
jgi:hypothetical protein